jgi:hypothetical protein
LVGRVAISCTLFTLAAFGGGLFLAHVSFNTPDKPIAVTPLPELLYLPPGAGPSSPTLGFADVQIQEPGPAAGPRLMTRGSSLSAISAARIKPVEPSVAAETERAQGRTAVQVTERKLDIGAVAETLADSSGHAFATRSEGTGPDSNPLVAAYQAVEVSAIPEPSSGLVVAFVIAAIIVSARLPRRRAITPL